MTGESNRRSWHGLSERLGQPDFHDIRCRLTGHRTRSCSKHVFHVDTPNTPQNDREVRRDTGERSGSRWVASMYLVGVVVNGSGITPSGVVLRTPYCKHPSDEGEAFSILSEVFPPIVPPEADLPVNCRNCLFAAA